MKRLINTSSIQLLRNSAMTNSFVGKTHEPTDRISAISKKSFRVFKIYHATLKVNFNIYKVAIDMI
jgi:hypothetical protein